MRFERRSKSMPELAEHLDEMATIVEHRRSTRENPAPSDNSKRTRRLRECVAVMVWEEEDGSETVSVVGDSQLGELELKGVLHDGIYAMTHIAEDRVASQ